MSKIVILGESPAGVKAAEKIRAKDPSCEITLVAVDGNHSYDRDRFVQYLSESPENNQLWYRPEDFYASQKISVITDQKVTRINFNRKKISTEEKQQIDFDVLILADMPQDRLPDIKGNHRTGLHGISRLSEFLDTQNVASLIDAVAIQSDTFRGFQFATQLAKRERETLWIVSANNILNTFFEGESFEWIKEELQTSGIRLVQETAIEEILGDTDTKAIRLETGKVLACELVLFGSTEPDLRIFNDTPLSIEDRILVDEAFKTNLEGVYALGDVIEQATEKSLVSEIYSLGQLEAQAEIMAAGYLKEETNVSQAIEVHSLALGDNHISIVGNPQITEQAAQKTHFNKEARAYLNVITVENVPTGAVVVNGEKIIDKIKQSIEQKTPIENFEGLISELEGANLVASTGEEAEAPSEQGPDDTNVA